MTREDLKELLDTLNRQGSEGLHVEAKRAERALPRRLWETLSAFSNSPGGGVLLLGVEQSDGFSVSGVRELAKVQSDLASLCDEMEPPLRPLVEVHEWEGASVLVVEVAELVPEQKPCFYRGAGLQGGAFIRVADGDRHLTPYEVHMLLEARGQPRYDIEPVPDSDVSDLSDDLLRPWLERMRARDRRYREWTPEQTMRMLHVLVKDKSDQVRVSLLGWLCFHAFPQGLYPNLCLTFVRYPGQREGELGPAGERFLDEARLEGPIGTLVPEFLSVAKRNMQKRGIIHGLFREEYWEYPETVLREAIVNAAGHRDYSPQSRGMPIQVKMFPDRLEIVSPGGLFGPVASDQLGQAGVMSSRNSFLMKILEDLPPPGERRTLCENRGTGLVSVLEELRRAHMSPPHFAVSLSRFQVGFPNYTLLDQDTLAWIEALPDADRLGQSQRLALAFLRHRRQLTNADYVRLTGEDSRVATRELGDLVARRLLRRNGSGRWSVYELEKASAASRGNRGEAILALLSERGPLSARELAAALGVHSRTVRTWLAPLVNEGKVMPLGKKRTPGLKYRTS